MAVDLDSVVGLIQKIYLLHEERVDIYKLFEEGHNIYLDSAPNYNFSKFRQLVNNITQEFKRISNSIIAIEKQLRFKGVFKIADIVTKLQDLEKTKLELSAKLQIAKQEVIDNTNSLDKRDLIVDIKQKIREIVELINQQILELRHEMVDFEEVNEEAFKKLIANKQYI
ncbi:required for excision 1-B domain-containing protein-like [Oppia nitens]|uniref:required for excision 1-B domain-containing protein-like n=1 Tax=Oppia nitens TaxID=1686743 RepID=UPI0023DA8989|nr:required for excision 1-B domain-containing protein-like [Oppia nitens]